MIFGISGTKRTVRNREVSVRRGLTVVIFVFAKFQRDFSTFTSGQIMEKYSNRAET